MKSIWTRTSTQISLMLILRFLRSELNKNLQEVTHHCGLLIPLGLLTFEFSLAGRHNVRGIQARIWQSPLEWQKVGCWKALKMISIKDGPGGWCVYKGGTLCDDYPWRLNTANSWCKLYLSVYSLAPIDVLDNFIKCHTKRPHVSYQNRWCMLTRVSD